MNEEGNGTGSLTFATIEDQINLMVLISLDIISQAKPGCIKYCHYCFTLDGACLCSFSIGF